MAPAMTLRRVDFPAPFGPINPVIVPRLTLNEQSSTARLPPNAFVMGGTSSRASCWFASVVPGASSMAPVVISLCGVEGARLHRLLLDSSPQRLLDSAVRRPESRLI